MILVQSERVFSEVRVGCDHAGFPLLEVLLPLLEEVFPHVEVWGPDSAQTSVDYPFYAQKVAGWVQHHPKGFGLLICGSGVGMSIAANRFSGVRAALCESTTTARLSREHNDANILVLGARIIGAQIAKECLHAFLYTKFQQGRHADRVAQIEGAH